MDLAWENQKRKAILSVAVAIIAPGAWLAKPR